MASVSGKIFEYSYLLPDHLTVVFCSLTPIQVREWHKKLEEVRLHELRKNREVVAQREEIRYLKNLVAMQERSISSLEEELVQQNNVKDPV